MDAMNRPVQQHLYALGAQVERVRFTVNGLSISFDDDGYDFDFDSIEASLNDAANELINLGDKIAAARSREADTH